MKTSLLIVLGSLASGLLATPSDPPVTYPESSFPKLAERAACYHESDCGWGYAAKCEHYCRQYGQDVGVARMEKCSFLNDKRCCCTK